jgi:hypothetical protein
MTAGSVRWPRPCPLCGVFMDRKGRGNHRMATPDHILPRAWGGGDVLWWSATLPSEQRVRNLRWLCRPCNGMRGHLGHCVGAVASVLTVSRDVGKRPAEVARTWRMGRIAHPLQGPLPSMLEDCRRVR